MPLTLRPLRSPVARLLLAGVGAVLTVCVLVFSGTPQGRVQQQQEAIASAQSVSDAVALNTLGRTFLEAPKQDPSAYVTARGLDALDKGIDPAKPNGGLFPLRKAMEQLAGFLMWPMIVVSILHALVRGQGAADKKLLDVGIRFFTVVFLLWVYPVWDLMLYRGIAVPLTNQLTSGELVKDVVESIARAGGRDDWQTFGMGMENSTPAQELSRISTSTAECAVQLELGAGDPQAGKSCFGDEVPAASQAIAARDIDGYIQAPDSMKAAWNNQLHADVRQKLEHHNGQARKASWWGSRLWARVTGAAHMVTNPSEWLANTVMGIFLQIQTLLMSMVMWFVWLGVLIARAFSFSLAPIAIVWGLMPNGGQKAERWFTGHAGIVLMPVGFAFGVLLFYAMQVAIFATNMASNAVLGVGIKLAMFIALCGVLFKAGNLSKIIAGDVTAVAKDIGDTARNRTIQIAGAVAMAAGGAVVAGGGALASSATGATVKGGARAMMSKQMANPESTMNRMARAVTGNKMGASDLAARLGFGRNKEGVMTRRESGPLSKTAKVAWGAVKDTAHAAKVGSKQGLATGKVRGWDQLANPTSPAALRDYFVNPVKDAAKSLADARKEKRERPGYASDATADLLRAVPEDADERAKKLKQFGLTMRDIHKQDLAFLAQNIKVSDLTIAGRKAGDLEQGRSIGTALLHTAIGQGVRIDATPNADGSMSIAEKTAADLTKLYESDLGFRAMLLEDARRTFGADGIPMVQGREGKVLDIATWANRSMAATNAFAIAAAAQERLDQEAFRRTMVTVAAGAEHDSLMEVAAHNVNPSLAERLPDENQRDFENRVQAEATRVLRMAWYEMASPDERAQVGLPAQGAHTAAAENAAIDVESWLAEGSVLAPSVMVGDAEVPTASMVEAVRTMGQRHMAHVEAVLSRKVSHDGKTFGIVGEKFLKTREVDYTYDDGSLMERVFKANPALKSDMEKAYRTAVEHALKEFANELPERLSDEDILTYAKRIEPELNICVLLDPMTAKSMI